MKKFFTLCITSVMVLSNTAPAFAYNSINHLAKTSTEANEIITNDTYGISHNDALIYQYILQEEIKRFDNYVTLENGIFVISEMGYLELSEMEVNRLNEILSNTNANIKIISSTAKYNFIENNTIIITDTNNLHRNGGVDTIRYYWWGPRVYMSARTLNTMGATVAIAGIVITHPVASRATQIAGVIMQTTNRGIWFDLNPLAHMFPSSVVGAGLQ